MPKKVNEVKFEVVYNPDLIIRIGEVMSRCDLGISGAEMPVTIIASWKTTSVINKKYLEKMKKALKMSVEEDGSKVISIKRV